MVLSDEDALRDIGRRCACFNLRRAARLVTQRFDRAFRWSGITANQFSILMAAHAQSGVLLTRMAKMLGMERTTLSRNASMLEKKGLVSVTLGHDKRERKIAVTENGRAMLEKTLPYWQHAQREVLAVIGEDKWEGLLSGLHEVARKL